MSSVSLCLSLVFSLSLVVRVFEVQISLHASLFGYRGISLSMNICIHMFEFLHIYMRSVEFHARLAPIAWETLCVINSSVQERERVYARSECLVQGIPGVWSLAVF
jgi:hypothetical protein